jgi:hypothetical protein
VIFTISFLRKKDYLIYQTGTFSFDHWVLKWILCESTSRGFLDCLFTLLLFVKHLWKFFSRFVYLSSVCQTKVSDFDNFNSAASYCWISRNIYSPPLSDVKGLSKSSLLHRCWSPWSPWVELLFKNRWTTTDSGELSRERWCWGTERGAMMAYRQHCQWWWWMKMKMRKTWLQTLGFDTMKQSMNVVLQQGADSNFI